MANVDYVNNPNQRTPCVLVLDASYSMGNQQKSGKKPIDALNDGLKSLEIELKKDPSALTRVQLCIICVGGPKSDASIMMDWTDVINFESFELSANGNTPLAEGLLLGLKTLEDAKSNLNMSGISYTRPWMMVMSDGEPTSSPSLWDKAITECQKAQTERKVEIFSIAVEGASLEKLGQISTRPVNTLDGLKFNELFVWLSKSLSAASKSRPGDKLNLPSTDTWRNVGI